MRILFISNLFPPDIGGPATHVSRLAQDLHGRGHQVRAVVCAENASFAGPEPYPVRRISRKLPVPLRFLQVFVSAWWWALRSDLLYINGLELPAVAAGLAAFKPRLLKVVGDFAWEYAIRHGWTSDGIDEFQRRRYALKVELVRFVQRLYCTLSSRIVTPSKYLQSLVTGWGLPRDKVVVINNALVGAPASDTAPVDIRRALGVKGPIVLTVARLYPWKTVDDLIRMSPSFIGGATLVIVGDGPERTRLEQLARDLKAPVLFVGAVSQADVHGYLAAADVFVLNTRYEGMSHVLLEARCAGAAIVTTSVGGNLEILEPGVTALLVEFGDHRAMVDAVNSILTDRAFRQRLSAAGRRGMEHFAWGRLVHETLDLLASMAARQPAPDASA